MHISRNQIAMSAQTDSEYQAALNELARFRPRHAVKTLLEIEPSESLRVLKTWQLARLMAWAMLDQKPGKREPKRDELDELPKRKIKTANAKRGGELALFFLFDQTIKKFNANDSITRDLRLVFHLIQGWGGFLQLAGGRGGRALLRSAQKKIRKFEYVRRTVEYLCRCEIHHPHDKYFDIRTALDFVAKNKANATPARSSIEKYWLEYKNSAPYIFAFYEFISSLEQAKSPRDLFNSLERLATDDVLLKRLLGHAAYVEKVLTSKAQNRRRDFTSVEQIPPVVRAFEAAELEIINKIFQARETDSSSNFRPKMKKKKKV